MKGWTMCHSYLIVVPKVVQFLVISKVGVVKEFVNPMYIRPIDSPVVFVT
jgi:hypothetical protein